MSESDDDDLADLNPDDTKTRKRRHSEDSTIPRVPCFVGPLREGTRSLFFWCEGGSHWHSHGLPEKDYGSGEEHRVSNCEQYSTYTLIPNYHTPDWALKAWRAGRPPKKP